MSQRRRSSRKSESASGKSPSEAGAILSQPSKASQAARQVERSFAAGVDSALRIARARGVAVTVQDANGKLVSGIPRQRGGSFTIAEGRGTSVKESETRKESTARNRKR